MYTFGLFMTIAGFVIGLGAVTVIDIHGFLGRKSTYWTEATTRTHKITKPMIWVGIALISLGQYILSQERWAENIFYIQTLIIIGLILNGLFLSFKVSPYMLKREEDGRADNLLPKNWQRKITFSLIISDIGWWTSLILFVIYL